MLHDAPYYAAVGVTGATAQSDTASVPVVSSARTRTSQVVPGSSSASILAVAVWPRGFHWGLRRPVSYTHLTLPTKLEV